MPATDLETLVLRIEASATKFERDMARAVRTVDGASSKMQRSMSAATRDINRSLDGIGDGAKSIAPVFARLGGAIAAAFSTQKIIAAADSYNRAQNALKVAGLEGSRLAGVFDQLYKAAQDNGAPIEALTELYGRAASASKILGANDQKLVAFSEGVAVALRSAGTSAGQASGALLQLGQALAGGTVRAEEYNSILEGARPILQTVANGLQQAGGDIGKLRKIMEDGRLTSRLFFDAFLAGTPKLRQTVAGSVPTIAASMTVLDNSLTNLVGRFDAATGASKNFAENTKSIAGVLDGLPGKFNAAERALQSYKDALNKGVVGDVAQAVGATDYAANLRAGVTPTARPVEADRAGLDKLAADYERALARIQAKIDQVRAVPLLRGVTEADREASLGMMVEQLESVRAKAMEVRAALAQIADAGAGWVDGAEVRIGRAMMAMQAPIAPVDMNAPQYQPTATAVPGQIPGTNLVQQSRTVPAAGGGTATVTTTRPMTAEELAKAAEAGTKAGVTQGIANAPVFKQPPPPPAATDPAMQATAVQTGVTAAAPSLVPTVNAGMVPTQQSIERGTVAAGTNSQRVTTAIGASNAHLAAIDQSTDATTQAVTTGAQTTVSAIGQLGTALSSASSGGSSSSSGEGESYSVASVLDVLQFEFQGTLRGMQNAMNALNVDLMEAQLKGNTEEVERLTEEIQKLQLRIAQFQLTEPTQYNTPGYNNAATNGAMYYARNALAGGFKPASYAHGGSFKVGGSGGVDSQLVQFYASPGETVSIDNGAGSKGKGDTKIMNVNVKASDEKSFRRSRRQLEREARRLSEAV
jgi:tape measure domain-containing protein